MNLTRLSKSGIEYLDYAWNFYSGCLNKKSGICLVQNCWAEGITVRFPDRYPNGFEPTYYPEAFLSPMSLKKPSVIGCAFMGDLFGDWVDPEERLTVPVMQNIAGTKTVSLQGISVKQAIFSTIRCCPQHTFLFLTKCPWNLSKWSPFPENCRVGVTTTNPQMFYEAQQYLSNIVATVRYISLEPFLERIWAPMVNGGVLGQLIIGAQTKPYRPPRVEWVEDMVKACDKAGVPVFIKHNINSENLPDNAFNEKGLVRQELP